MTNHPQDPTPNPPSVAAASYTAPGQPTLNPQQERGWATASHVIPLVAMVLSAGVLGFVASLVMYLVMRDRGPFVRQAAANSLNVQIITGIVLVISVPLMLVLIGFATWGLALVFAFIVHVIAAIKANQGEWYSPPLTPHFVK
ncbi:MAG: DUF4870 domain-containing protein [Nostocoides sp.]